MIVFFQDLFKFSASQNVSSSRKLSVCIARLNDSAPDFSRTYGADKHELLFFSAESSKQTGFNYHSIPSIASLHDCYTK